MFSTKKSARILAAAALAATLCGAAPAQAADRGEAPADLLDRLFAWVVEIWASEAPDGGPRLTYEQDGPYVDPNGGGPRPGSCDTDPGCNSPKQAIANGRP